MPEDVVRAQHRAVVHAHQSLAAEGFNTIVFAYALERLVPFLGRLSQAREADLGRDGSEGLGDLLLVRRFFDPECDGQAWTPAYSVSCLYRALTGELTGAEDIVCTVHGGFDDTDQEGDDHDQDDGPAGRADLEGQYVDAVRA
ncbi:hypothetical protein [Streptomyces sp. NPDC057375]|uniref:hypothetical protein n=1 Tax=Streptomyces sp. NPDC057375 TaxID=3346109 RepID=UPI003638F884